MPAPGRAEEPLPSSRRPLVAWLVVGAGALGASGVAISAAATHRGGGALATTAGLFCLLHAAAILAAAAHARTMPRPSLLLGAAVVMAIGTVLFAGDLAIAGFGGLHPVPAAAPVGGMAMIAGWVLMIAAGAREALSARKGPSS